MKRTPMPPRRAPMTRGPMKKANRKRRASEFARCYHSRERVAWVKSLPCVVCVSLAPVFGFLQQPIDNAHVGGNDGMGRKGPFTEIVPLCRSHHRRFDERRFPFDMDEMRAALLADAARVEALWQAHRATQGGPEQ